MPFTLVAKVRREALAQDEEIPASDPVAERQKTDPKLRPIMIYLESGVLPEDQKEAREIVLASSQYSLLEGVLYHVEKDKTLRVVPPAEEREKLFHEAHDGKFGGHLRDAKVHGQLILDFWW